MKKKMLINYLIVLIISLSPIYSQTYNLLNDIFYSNEGKNMYLNSEFIKTNGENSIELHKYLNENFIKENWEYLPSSNTPSLKGFLENFDLSIIKKKAYSQNKNKLIKFGKLQKHVIAVNGFEKSNSYMVISKPIFNCSKDWAILYKYSIFSIEVGTSGYLMIYRKLDDKWIEYHKISLGIS